MKQLSDLLKQIKPLEVVGSCEREVRALSFDSREVGEGYCFFAVRGTQVDGHNFIAKASDAGASVVVCETLPEALNEQVSYVVVEDSTAAMADIAAAFYDNPSHALTLVGVTGTNGKTTTATLLYELVRRLGYRAGLISTVVYKIDDREITSTHTTPDTIRLNEMLRNGEMRKLYWAIVETRPEREEGELRHYIVRDSRKNRSYAYDTPRKDAKEARLRYKMLGCSDRYTLLEVELLTGRHHQIRAQLSKIGCPIKGDLKYGAKRSNPNGGISLHSYKMNFAHPIGRKTETEPNRVELVAVPQEDNLWNYFFANFNDIF